jgi:hypothetical protein
MKELTYPVLGLHISYDFMPDKVVFRGKTGGLSAQLRELSVAVF